MQTFYADCLNNLQELHSHVEKALEGLSPEALDWSPKPEVNSITTLVVHITGSERFLFGEIIAGQPFGRDRDSEFRAKDIAPNILIQRLSDSSAYIESVLEPLTLADMETKRTFGSREVTVGWVLGHALKHTGTHLGNIQVMRDLWDQFKA
ncbi:MAG: DinB family protein [Chloroflexota bacterium]